MQQEILQFALHFSADVDIWVSWPQIFFLNIIKISLEILFPT